MKDELNGKVVKEYIGLRSKMYSIDYDTGNTRKAKGISKSVVKSQIKHENYKEALFDDKVFFHDNIKIVSSQHQINTTQVHKKSLASNDTKRVRCSPDFSYAIGHYKLRLVRDPQCHQEQSVVPT